MSISKIAGLLLSSASMVAAHGYVSGAVVDGTYHKGFIVDTYNYMTDVPENIGWAEDATDLGFVDGSGYAGNDIICHKDATPGAISADVKAGGKVELQWTDWPESHHGPVITYLANCNGDCSSVDKTALEFFKIDEAGLIDDSNVPGTWASDNLISANNSWTVTIPSSIASGNYVLRHEIIALHSAGESNGAQNYPQCLNLKVTGGGSDSPSGTKGTALYKNTDAGILVNIYTSMDSYEIPGPALYSGASSGSTTAAATTAAATTAAATQAATTAAPAASASSTASAADSVTVTATAVGGQSAQSSTPASGDDSSAEASSTAVAVPTPTASSSSSSSSTVSDSDYSSYLSSLSADQLITVIRSTLKWLVSDNKVHARALSS